jgi:RNA polymerase sigma-70 factor (ECF subfamily)
MLGSVADAEDVVQEVYVRFQRAVESGTDIDSPKAYLTTTTTRLAIDELRSARMRRESYVGTWLPEPLLTDTSPDAAQHAETADSLSMALLVVLERLSPVERAVFLLRDVFDYDYKEIAQIVGKSEANVRQLAVRARRYVDERRPRFEASRRQRDELARRFFAAVEKGDTDALVDMLAADVVLYGDGGGKAPAIIRPFSGGTGSAGCSLHGFRTGFVPGSRWSLLRSTASRVLGRVPQTAGSSARSRSTSRTGWCRPYGR